MNKKQSAKKAHPNKYRVEYIKNKGFDTALAMLRGPKDEIFGLDIETAEHEDYRGHPQAGLNTKLSHIRLIQIAVSKYETVYVFDVYYLKQRNKDKLLNFIRKNKFFAHTAQFEAAHFQEVGIETLNVQCTQIMYRMLVKADNPNTKNVGASLQAVCQDVLNVTVDKSEQTSDWNKKKLDPDQIEYAARDAAYTLVLGQAFLPKLLKEMPKAYRINTLAINPLARATRNGIYINKKAYVKMVNRWEKQHKRSHKKLVKQYGNINFNSFQQVGKLLRENFPKDVIKRWPKTPTGGLKTDKDTLKDFSHIKGIGALRDYKNFQKKVSTYGHNYLEWVNPITKRIHPSYSLAYTDTNRLSSWDPNIQNQPSDDEVRRKYKHQYKDTILVGADYSQVEAKIAAILSEDQVLLDIFRKDLDVYRYVASEVLHVAYEDVTDEQRKIGKSLVLGLFFGMGAATYIQYSWVNYQIKMTLEEGQKFIGLFQDLFSRLREWQLEVAAKAECTLISKTQCGQIRKLKSGRTYSVGMNNPVQGSAAEAMNCALIRTDKLLRKKKIKGFVCADVHDELVLEVVVRQKDEAAKLLKKGMLRGFKDVFPDTMGIKRLVDCKIGKTWADLK